MIEIKPDPYYGGVVEFEAAELAIDYQGCGSHQVRVRAVVEAGATLRLLQRLTKRLGKDISDEEFLRLAKGELA